MRSTNLSEFRNNLKQFHDSVEGNNETLIIKLNQERELCLFHW